MTVHFHQVPRPGKPVAAGRKIREDAKRWRAVIEATGMKVD